MTNPTCFKLSIENNVAHIQLSQPEAFNAMPRAFWNELPVLVNDISDNAKARCIVLSSTGKHFTAGMDISVFTDGDGVATSGGDQHSRAEAFRQFVLTLQGSFRCLDTARMPVIAAIQGGCIGGGVDMVSGDLKPENLFLTRREDGTALVKILDYGLVKMVENATAQTQTGEILGTPRYMAPEQARGDVEQIGPGTDRWALGLIAYKFVTGEDYWNAKTVHHLLAQIVYEEVAPPSTRGAKLGPAFDTWFATACHREPELRFSSAAEQIEALAEVLGAPSFPVARTSDSGAGARVSKRPPDPADHAATLRASSVDALGRPKRPARGLLLGGAVAALVLALGATVALTYLGFSAATVAYRPGAPTSRRIRRIMWRHTCRQHRPAWHI